MSSVKNRVVCTADIRIVAAIIGNVSRTLATNVINNSGLPLGRFPFASSRGMFASLGRLSVIRLYPVQNAARLALSAKTHSRQLKHPLLGRPSARHLERWRDGRRNSVDDMSTEFQCGTNIEEAWHTFDQCRFRLQLRHDGPWPCERRG